MAVLNHLKFPIVIEEFGETQEYEIVIRRRTAQEFNELHADLRAAGDDQVALNKLAISFFDKLFVRIDGLLDADNQPLTTIEHVENYIKVGIYNIILEQSKISVKNSLRTSTPSEADKKSEK